MNPLQNDSCAICSKEPEDMLLLECTHNLCLDCATELFAASQQDCLQCEICCVQTRLDQETVQCLASLAQQPPSPMRLPEPTLPRLPKEPRGLQCLEHREKALYYCFDCQIGTICSECILATTHAGHRVNTLKKAAKTLLESLAVQGKELEELKGKLLVEAETVRTRRDQLAGQLAQRQRKLKLIFDDMMRQVASRFNELSTELQRHCQRGIEIAEGTLNATLEKVALVENALIHNRETLQLNDSEAILRRASQLQTQLAQFKPETPAILPSITLMLHQEDAVFVDLETLLQRISWEDLQLRSLAQQPYQQQPNIRVQSLLGDSYRYVYPELDESQLRENEMNQSVNRYSGIKNSSRRLELSRSMENATNIINKLQQRLRK